MLAELAYPVACLNGLVAAYLDSETVVGRHVPSNKAWLPPYLGTIDMGIFAAVVPSSYFYVSEVCYVGSSLLNSNANYEESSASALEIFGRLGVLHPIAFYYIHYYVNPIELSNDETSLVLSAVHVSD